MYSPGHGSATRDDAGAVDEARSNGGTDSSCVKRGEAGARGDDSDGERGDADRSNGRGDPGEFMENGEGGDPNSIVRASLGRGGWSTGHIHLCPWKK